MQDKDGVKSKVQVSNGQTAIGTVLNDGLADVYVGGPVDFGNAGLSLDLDLGNTNQYADNGINFMGVASVKAADGYYNKVIGDAKVNNTIIGGADGHNSLWGGGASNDVLMGDANADDDFYFGLGEGNDSIIGFTTGDNGQSDKLNIFSGFAKGASRDANGNIIVHWSDGSKLTITSTDGANSSVNDVFEYGQYGTEESRFIKIGRTDAANTFEYAANVNEYYGNSTDENGNHDTLTVGVSTAAARIYLEGVSYDGAVDTKYRGITNIDASASAGNLELAGSGLADTIIGGAGSNSLWGGSGKQSDSLIGGTGHNTFYFGLNEGHDIIAGSHNTDKVILYNVSSEQIVAAALNGANFEATLTDGSKLTIENIQDGFTATLADKTIVFTGGSFV